MRARDLAKELRDAAERQVVTLDRSFCCHAGELRHEAEMPTDDAPDQTLPREPVQPLVLAVARRRRKHERKIAWRAGLDEARFERGR